MDPLHLFISLILSAISPQQVYQKVFKHTTYTWKIQHRHTHTQRIIVIMYCLNNWFPVSRQIILARLFSSFIFFVVLCAGSNILFFVVVYNNCGFYHNEFVEEHKKQHLYTHSSLSARKLKRVPEKSKQSSLMLQKKSNFFSWMSIWGWNLDRKSRFGLQKKGNTFDALITLMWCSAFT